MTQKNSPPIDLNTADESALVEKLNIPGRLAKRIIALRPYRSVEEIQKVWGIDPSELQRILPLLSVSRPNTTLSDIVTRLGSGQEPKAPSKPVEPKKPAALPAPARAPKEKIPWQVSLLLALIFLAGSYFRFSGLNWDDGHHQHPDERFISMVADQIKAVSGVAQYFNTAESPMNPLRFGSYTYGMFPLFFTHTVARWLGMSSYDSVTLAGRAVSGLFDLLAVWMLYLLGTSLYNRRIGLLAAALGAAAVLPIQLSHYFAVDSFSTVFVIAGFYYALQAVPIHQPGEKIQVSNLFHFALFGLIIGLAGACKVNTLPLFGIIVLAGAAYLVTAWKTPGFTPALIIIGVGGVLAALMTFLAFRVFQPYAFSGPGFFGLTLNPEWLRVMKEVINQVAGNSDWPPNTHWTNRPFTYAWTNMVMWGMGLPLGLAGWLGWGWAAKRAWSGEWRSHLLPLAWVAGYFIWQNMQFWRYMRYFLPIYPFIILFAAWALIEIYDRTGESRARLISNGIKLPRQFADWRSTWQGMAGLLILVLTVAGTYTYAFAFTQIYNRPITRIAASEWMLENISAPLNVIVESPQGRRSYPVAVGNRQTLEPAYPGSANIHVLQHGSTSSITTADVRQVGVSFYFKLTRDMEGNDLITEGRLSIDDDDPAQQQIIPYGDITLDPNRTYYFHYRIQSSSQFSLSNVLLRNVDENLPSIFVNLELQSQSGVLEGSVPVTPQESMNLNRLDIKSFQQVFVPAKTTIKVTIFKESDTNTPLVETSQTLVFSEPGLRLSPVFHFPPLEVFGGQTYQVRYEITSGFPLHLFGESYTLETSWDDALPLNINQYDVQGGIFMPLNLELYEPDTPQKREAMLKTLAEVDYIVIPSNRAYDAMPRLPLRYPLALKYYQALFDCACSGNALENRAYGLEVPFKSPLGFELAATFESPPALGFLKFPDQAADESFTVYDHPKVMIFKKTQDFSIDKVAAYLNSVDLNQVVLQNPSQYTKAPTVMRLPADRLQAQRSSTDWSALFDRYSMLNVNQGLGGVVWYLFIFLLGLILFPSVFHLFPWLPDRGYPLMRMAGLLSVTWLVWILGSFKILTFSRFTIWFCLILILLLNALLAYRRREALSNYLSSNWKHILGVEAVFLAVFLFSLSVRLGNPDLWHPWLGGEKPMDFAFFNAVLRSVYFPPEHPWFAGHYINYYYYGYIIAAVPAKLLGILPSTAYNLILPTWFAMTGIGVFSVAFNLVSGLRQSADGVQRFAKRLPYLAGAFALLAVMFLGNLSEVRVLWRYLPEAAANGSNTSSPLAHVGSFLGGAARVLTGQSTLPGNNGRWYFEASRPILPEGPDTPIAEFPYFTFLYGDMHPHLLAMPVYALVFGWLLNLLLWPASRKKWTDLLPGWIAAGLIFGSFRASHTWDFPTFLGLGVLVVLWDVWRSRTDSVKETIQTIFVHELTFVGIAVAFYWPFTQWFKTGYASVEIWKGASTPLTDYFLVFGLPLFLMVSLLARSQYADLGDGYQLWLAAGRERLLDIFKWRYLRWYLALPAIMAVSYALWHFDYPVPAFGFPFLAGLAWLILFKSDATPLQRITWILFGLGLSITLFVEVFVLKGDVGRSNTVFRFYMQAWFVFGLAGSLALIELLAGLADWPHWTKYAWALILIGLVLSGAVYPLIATNKKVTDRWPDIQAPPHTLDGALFMLGDAVNSNPAIYTDDNRPLDLSRDYAAIQFMQDRVSGSPVIVEGHTEEYRWGSRFSIYTGLPSVVGWSWHVRQHNSLLDGAIVDRLIEAVNNFYNTADIPAARQFLDQNQVRYIIVGDLERAYYDPYGLDKFRNMVDQGILKIVFGDNSPNTTTIFEVIKVR